MESVFHGTIYEPYDFLTAQSHTLVIHANPAAGESPVLRGRKLPKEKMQELSLETYSIFRSCISPDMCLQALPIEGFLVLALGLDLPDPFSQQQEKALSERLFGMLERALEQLFTQYGLMLQLSVSAIHINTQNVFDAYQESFSVAVHFPFLQQSGHIIFFQDFQRGLSHADADAKKLLERQWGALMDAQNYEDAEPVLLQIVRLRASAPLAVTSLTQELISRMEFYVYQLFDANVLRPSGHDSIMRSISLIHSVKTMPELQNQIHEIYQAIAAGTMHSGAENERGWAQKIAWYIRSSYADPALNAERISRQFGLHPAYVSSIFHRGIGIKLIDYIHLTRIEQIKRLLKNTDMSLSNIAVKSGYFDRYAMSRVFHRYVGMTPSDYRRK